MTQEDADLAAYEAEEIVRLSNARTPEAIERIAHTILRSITAYQGGPGLAALVVRRLREMACERRKAAWIAARAG